MRIAKRFGLEYRMKNVRRYTSTFVVFFGKEHILRKEEQSIKRQRKDGNLPRVQQESLRRIFASVSHETSMAGSI